MNLILITLNLNGAGSTFIYPVLSRWSLDYYNKAKIQINYQSIGSGGGIKQVKERTVDFGASDMPLSPSSLDSGKLYQFPAVVGGVVAVVNLPGLKEGQIKLSSDVICDIFMGKIKRWDDPKIKNINPNIKLPQKGIVVVHRSDGSGTTFIWTNYLSKACPQWSSSVGYGTSVNWPTGIGAKGNEGVANYIRQTPYSIGYVEFAYVLQNKLIYTQLQNKNGKFVLPTFESFSKALENIKWDPDNHFYQFFTYQEGDNTWPAVGATFILIPREKKDKNEAICEFFKWVFDNEDYTTKQLFYVPLSKSVKEAIYNYWKKYNICS